MSKEANHNDADVAGEIPKLEELFVRHRGLTKALCESYAEAASVCLSRHHEPPVIFSINKTLAPSKRSVTWRQPDERTKSAWANRDDSTRDGAYSVSIATVEAEYGLLTIGRAETRTGADYLLAPPGPHEDWEEALRLEVSGTDTGDAVVIRSRLKQKVQQVRDGEADSPALACVVGFAEKQVAIERVTN